MLFHAYSLPSLRDGTSRTCSDRIATSSYSRIRDQLPTRRPNLTVHVSPLPLLFPRAPSPSPLSITLIAHHPSSPITSHPRHEPAKIVILDHPSTSDVHIYPTTYLDHDHPASGSSIMSSNHSTLVHEPPRRKLQRSVLFVLSPRPLLSLSSVNNLGDDLDPPHLCALRISYTSTEGRYRGKSQSLDLAPTSLPNESRSSEPESRTTRNVCECLHRRMRKPEGSKLRI